MLKTYIWTCTAILVGHLKTVHFNSSSARWCIQHQLGHRFFPTFPKKMQRRGVICSQWWNSHLFFAHLPPIPAWPLSTHVASSGRICGRTLSDSVAFEAGPFSPPQSVVVGREVESDTSDICCRASLSIVCSVLLSKYSLSFTYRRFR